MNYTIDDSEGPYKAMNQSPVYSKLTYDSQLVAEDTSDQWDEKFDEVSCNLYHFQKFDNKNDVSTTYLRGYISEDFSRTFPVDNHIPMDGRGVTESYLYDHTPMKLFFDSGASRRKFYDPTPSLHYLPKFVTTCTGI